LMLELSRRNLEKTDFYRDQLDLLNWADRLKADTSSERQVLTEQLQNQAAHLQSLVSYNQQQMTALVEDVNEAGKDASSEQRAQLSVLKERLNN
nr:mechanosensitive ion channel family protein [Shewanella shenzhenensis]